MKESEDRDEHKRQEYTPENPNPVRIVKEGVEEQGPGVNNSISAPGLAGKLGVVRQRLSDPLILHRPLEEKFRNQKEENPLERDQADIAPDLKLVFAVKAPALHGLNAKDGHHHGVQNRVPERPWAVKEGEERVAPSVEGPEFLALADLGAVYRIKSEERRAEPGVPVSTEAREEQGCQRAQSQEPAQPRGHEGERFHSGIGAENRQSCKGSERKQRRRPQITFPFVLQSNADGLQELDRKLRADQDKGMVVGDLPHGLLAPFVNFQRISPVFEFFDIRIQNRLDFSRRDGFVELALVVLEDAGELIATIGQHDLVLFGQDQGGLDGAVPPADYQNLFARVMPGRVEAMIHLLSVFARHMQLARVSALAYSHDHTLRLVSSLRGPHFEDAFRHAFDGVHAFFRLDVELVLLDDLVPARDQIFLLGSVQPKLALGRSGVRLGIDPLLFREVFDRVGDLGLFQDHMR